MRLSPLLGPSMPKGTQASYKCMTHDAIIKYHYILVRKEILKPGHIETGFNAKPWPTKRCFSTQTVPVLRLHQRVRVSKSKPSESFDWHSADPEEEERRWAGESMCLRPTDLQPCSWRLYLGLLLWCAHLFQHWQAEEKSSSISRLEIRRGRIRKQ